jgi:hypothetical protein
VQIVVSAVTAALVESVEMGLGEHRLRALSRADPRRSGSEEPHDKDLGPGDLGRVGAPIVNDPMGYPRRSKKGTRSARTTLRPFHGVFRLFGPSRARQSG